MVTRALVFVPVFSAFCFAQGLIFPPTPCDAFQAGARDINGNNAHLTLGMSREDGTKAFRYGSSAGNFVSLQGDIISINFRLLFSPASTPENIKLLSFDASCGGTGVTVAGFGPDFVDVATQQDVALSFNRVTYDATLNSVVVGSRPSGTPRYIWVEVWNGITDIPIVASFSYLIDIQNPQNPQPAQPSLLFPLADHNPYEVEIASVMDHDRRPDILVSYAAERGRAIDSTPARYPLDKNILGYSATLAGNRFPTFFLNGAPASQDRHIWYERGANTGAITYQHPGYDYPDRDGTILAPADGVLYIVKNDPVVRTATGEHLVGNGSNSTASAWCGFHTFKIVETNGAESWFLHAKRFLSSGERNAKQDMNSLVRSAMVGDLYYNCQRDIGADVRVTTVTAGEPLAVVGGFNGPKPPFRPHLHFEQRLNGLLVDPYGWEGEGTDPLASNLGLLLWSGYVRPTVSDVTLQESTGLVTVTGKDFTKSGTRPLIELWRHFEDSSDAFNHNDGTNAMVEISTLISLSDTQIVGRLDLHEPAQRAILSNPGAYVIKVEAPYQAGKPNGPRSRATVIKSVP